MKQKFNFVSGNIEFCSSILKGTAIIGDVETAVFSNRRIKYLQKKSGKAALFSSS